jgi:hypothetical protein
LVGYGATAFDQGCEGGWDWCNNAATVYENNVFLGYVETGYNQSEEPGIFYEEPPANMPANQGWAVRDHNFIYNTKSCPTPLQTGEHCNTEDPLFVGEPASPLATGQSGEELLDNFNFTPASGSPLVGAGIAIPDITLDYNGTTRPNPPAIGAIQ